MSSLGHLSVLQEQAIRLLRTKWRNNADLLANELFLILSSVADAQATGPVTTTPGNNLPSTQYPPLPQINFNFPPLDFPDLPGAPAAPGFTDNQGAPPLAPDQPPGGVRTKTTTVPQDVRVVVPGVVTGGSGQSYGVDLYPNGSQATQEDDSPTTVSVQANCPNIDPSETIPPGTWVWCFRYQRVNAILTQQLARLPSGPWVEVSRSTQYRVVSQAHDILPPVWLAGGSSS